MRRRGSRGSSNDGEKVVVTTIPSAIPVSLKEEARSGGDRSTATIPNSPIAALHTCSADPRTICMHDGHRARSICLSLRVV